MHGQVHQHLCLQVMALHILRSRATQLQDNMFRGVQTFKRPTDSLDP